MHPRGNQCWESTRGTRLAANENGGERAGTRLLADGGYCWRLAAGGKDTSLPTAGLSSSVFSHRATYPASAACSAVYVTASSRAMPQT